MNVVIGKHTLGLGHPTFIVAEISGNHGGSLDNCIQIVHAAKRAGVDAVKLQTYTADSITLNSNRDDFLIPSGTPWEAHSNLWNLYNKAHTPWDWHHAIFSECEKLNLEIFSSPFDEAAVDFLEELNCVAYKIASPEITHIPLLERVAKTGKPVIISTGIADVEDIELALRALRENGAKEIIMLKCTTSYPAPAEDSNLLTLTNMASRFDVLTGLSDHSLGTVAPICAVALGASFIEKHFKLESIGETVDSFFSLGEKEFSRMVDDIRFAEKSLGDVSYKISASAQPNLLGRRSLYVVKEIKAGEIFSDLNIKSIRPSFGLHPKFKKSIIGRRAKFDLHPGDRMSWDLVE